MANNKIVSDKIFLRHCIRCEFHQGKSAGKACRAICSVLGDDVVSKSTCEFWFRRFKQGNFDVNDRERCGAPKKFEDEELKELRGEDSSQTQKQLANILGVSQQTISNHLKVNRIKEEQHQNIKHFNPND